MKLEKVAEIYEINQENGCYVGSVDGYEYSLVQQQMGYVRVPALAFVFDVEGLNKQFKLFRKAAFGKVMMNSLILKNNVVLYILSPKNKEKDLEKLNALINVFKELELKPQNKCLFSGLVADSTKVINGIKINVNKDGITNFISKSEEELKHEKDNNKYLPKSMLFALIGAFVGLIPTIISVFVFQYFLALLYFIIPFLSFLFYKYGQGPKYTWVTYYIGGISLLIGVGFTLVYLWLVAIGNELSFGELFTHPDFKEYSLRTLALTTLFTVVGIFYTWRSIYNQTTGARKDSLQSIKKD